MSQAEVCQGDPWEAIFPISRRWRKCIDPIHRRMARKVRGETGTYCRDCASSLSKKKRSYRIGPSSIQKLYSYVKSRSRVTRASARVGCSITFEQFCRIRSGGCFYCSGPLPEHGVGLDRIDPARGYDADNVVPACIRCNHARGAFITFDEFRLIMANRRDRLGDGVDLWIEHGPRGSLTNARRIP